MSMTKRPPRLPQVLQQFYPKVDLDNKQLNKYVEYHISGFDTP